MLHRHWLLFSVSSRDIFNETHFHDLITNSSGEHVQVYFKTQIVPLDRLNAVFTTLPKFFRSKSYMFFAQCFKPIMIFFEFFSSHNDRLET